MTSPMVDSVRTVPLVVEQDLYIPMEAETDDSGFPFDREDRDDESFRSQLDDIAKRHPEFAEHLGGFPFRSETLGRRSRPPRPSDESDFRRFTGRPFGSARFEHFGFPFNSRDPFEEDYEASSQPPQPEPPQPEQPEEKQQAPERGRKPNIQQSNTVDLGQKQEPVNDRNQRSMSAPPSDNRQRFVSSIHIPINRNGGMGDMGTTQSQPQEKPVNKPTERVIPIHVEGRDEPVLPKNTNQTFSQPPQPERIFGHRPSQFTQFVGREPPKQYTAGPEWQHPPYQQQKFQQTTPPPQQAPPQQEKPQQQAPPQQEKPQEQVPQAPKATNNPIDIIQSIQKDVSELMGQVEKFNGMPRDKQYLYLDEMLTRNLIKLDNIDTQGQENIRQARKEAIKCIEGCIGILEAKAAANVPKQLETKQEEVETKPEAEVAEAEAKVAEAEVKVEESQVVEEKMEVEQKPEEEKVEMKEQGGEEKMEVVAPVVEEKTEAVIPEAVIAVATVESSDGKPDEEMKEVAPEESQKEGEEVKGNTQEENKDETSEDKKEKKKGKKKVVKK